MFVFLAFLGVAGGTSKPESLTLLMVRPVCVVVLGLLLAFPARRDWGAVRPWLVLLGSLAGWMLVQLILLPPSLWQSLPGHGFAAEAAVVAMQPQPWRPISLTPDLTINSLLDLLVPLVVLTGYAALDRRERGRLAWAIIAIACISAVVGLAQLAGGPSSGAYIYGDTDENLPVGLLSNRNHQALLLAIAIIAIGCVVQAGDTSGTATGRIRALWGALAGGAALLFLAMIVASGSRTGLLFGAAAIVIALGMNVGALRTMLASPGGRRRHRAEHMRRTMLLGGVIAGIAALIVALMAAIFVTGRGIAFARLSALTDTGAEMRWLGAPIVIEQMRAFFPVGSGFGSFDAVFRMAEPDRLLKPTYFNHAHNDVFETVLCGGLPGAALLVVFAWMCATRMLSIRRRQERGIAISPIVLGGSIIVLTVCSSLVDYPLRTPMIAAIFALGCCWLGDRRGATPMERE